MLNGRGENSILLKVMPTPKDQLYESGAFGTSLRNITILCEMIPTDGCICVLSNKDTDNYIIDSHFRVYNLIRCLDHIAE